MADALSELLSTFYLSGTVFCRASFQAPWSTSTTGANDAIFHAVLEGTACIIVDGGEPIALGTGDVAVVLRGDRHVMCDDPVTPVIPLRDLVDENEDGVDSVDFVGGDGPITRILCGLFRLDRELPNPLLQVLPRVMVVRSSGDLADWLDTTLALLQAEVEAARPGADAVITRLTDALCVQLVRRYIEELPDEHASLLRALRDPQVSKVIALIHEQPEHTWTAAKLASRAGVSRSILFSRFETLLGRAPGDYLTTHRMNLAARLLRREGLTVSEVSSRVGYASESSFSKAFKRAMGVPPSAYRIGS